MKQWDPFSGNISLELNKEVDKQKDPFKFKDLGFKF
jgi:hypothetical protein